MKSRSMFAKIVVALILVGLILPLNAGVPKLAITPIEEESAVSAFESDLDQGDYPATDFNLEFDARYEGLGPILANVMGTAGAPAC